MFAMMKKLCFIALLITLLSSNINIVKSATTEVISVQTYMDYNHDNMFDPLTEKLSGITVFLIKQTEDFSAVRALQTNELGIADFSNVEKGEYSIEVCGNKDSYIVYTDDEIGISLILFNCLKTQIYMPIVIN